jgi:hypothetical protein
VDAQDATRRTAAKETTRPGGRDKGEAADGVEVRVRAKAVDPAGGQAKLKLRPEQPERAERTALIFSDPLSGRLIYPEPHMNK